MAALVVIALVAVISVWMTRHRSEVSATHLARSSGQPADLEAMFIGAHPDDEAFYLSTFGQWKDAHEVSTGILTITRGEGGGNAVGTEEGPYLGLLREAEEREAVGEVGITDVYNLDEVDFYYTGSAPLTATVWDHDDALAKAVRIIRQTRPEVLVTMDPAPTAGNHGNHQESARIAAEAYEAAGDPTRFREQIAQEGLTPFAPDRLFITGARGASSPGSDCAQTFEPTDRTETIYGTWSGNPSPDGRTWAAVEVDSQRAYATQGWSSFAAAPTATDELGCDYLTLVASRTPLAERASDAARATTAPLVGSVVALPGGLPLGSGLTLDADSSRALPGETLTVTVRARAPRDTALGTATAQLDLPSGWTSQGRRSMGNIGAGKEASTTLTVTPPASATTGTSALIAARVTTAAGVGYQEESVRVSAPVTASQQLQPRAARYARWASSADAELLADRASPVLTMASGGSRPVDVVVTNHSDRTQSGTVTPAAPAGFAMTPSSASYADLAPGQQTTVRFTATHEGNDDPPESVDHTYSIETTSRGASATTQQALELVPTVDVARAKRAPVIDGAVSPGEYDGEALPSSTPWEGQPCSSKADCSATSRLTWRGDVLYVAVEVTDDQRGAALPVDDCKRHWRTDAVEIAIDPRGTSENTSTTFKAGVLPWTAEGAPCHLRDADAHQGAGADGAPRMKVASRVTAPYTGYVIEAAIPMSLLPSAVDPEHLGVNVLVYDSDTQDKTGQTRIGWSAWGGVQSDPFRWGDAQLTGYRPPSGRSTEPSDPIMPTAALRSLASPQSIEQAVRTKVALSGRPTSPNSQAGWIEGATGRDSQVEVRLRVEDPGTAHITVQDARGIAGHIAQEVSADEDGHAVVSVELSRDLGQDAAILVGWDDGDGGTTASSARLRR